MRVDTMPRSRDNHFREAVVAAHRSELLAFSKQFGAQGCIVRKNIHKLKTSKIVANLSNITPKKRGCFTSTNCKRSTFQTRQVSVDMSNITVHDSKQRNSFHIFPFRVTTAGHCYIWYRTLLSKVKCEDVIYLADVA